MITAGLILYATHRNKYEDLPWKHVGFVADLFNTLCNDFNTTEHILHTINTFCLLVQNVKQKLNDNEDNHPSLFTC